MCWLSPYAQVRPWCHDAPPDSPLRVKGLDLSATATAASAAFIGPDSSAACPSRHSPGTSAGSKLGGPGPATRRRWRGGNDRVSNPGHGTRRTAGFEIHVR